MRLPRLPAGAALLLAAAALLVLYSGPLATRFLNDDYLFLEAAETQSLARSLAQPDPLGNYWRPLSRQIYFEALAPIGGGQPLVFHAVNAALFLAALALLADLLRVFLPVPGVMAGCLYFALLPFQRVNLTWVSCAQDLMALVASLGAIALYRRGRLLPAVLAYAAAVASKESALPLPLAIVAWEAWVERRGLRAGLLRATLFLPVPLAWFAASLTVGAFRAGAPHLPFDPTHFAAGYAHLVQSLLGIDDPATFARAMLAHGPAVAPLLMLSALALWPRPGGEAAGLRAGWLAFALAWLAAFGLATGPVSHQWSSYFYTLAAVGGALLVGALFRRADRWTWLVLVAGLLWWHAGANGVRTFAVQDRPWGWTSHLTSFYFNRAAALTDTLTLQLLELEPKPPHGSRLFFATLPPWAGFQMGNGALVRRLYDDDSLESYFYSQFSDRTAADRPCRFLYWDGARLRHLYPANQDAFFHVGGDLLLLDRPAHAAHAFRRGLAEGGDRMDHLYWLGWSLLWSGDRKAAEDTWTAFGAKDDSLYWMAHLRAAKNTLFDSADTLEARRHLIRAIEYGIGRPEAHAVLGELLQAERPKYAMLELKVAGWLDPTDYLTRRALALGLAAARLDEPARREFAALERVYPEWKSDSLVVKARRGLGSRTAAVARF